MKKFLVLAIILTDLALANSAHAQLLGIPHDVTLVAVPEPSTYGLLAVGMLLIGGIYKKFYSSKN